MDTGNPRIILKDMTIGGQPMRPGDVAMVSLPSANRDPAFMADAGVLDVTRQPQAHLAFGHGIHQCLGQQLARLEMSVALPALLQRFPTLSLAASEADLDISSGRSGQRHPCIARALVAQHSSHPALSCGHERCAAAIRPGTPCCG